MKRLNKKRFARFLANIMAFTFAVGIAVDVIRFPECYISTWRYQLQNDLQSGDEEANNYYHNTYIANGRELF